MIIARPDDIITCEKGHPLYRMVRDLSFPGALKVEDVEQISPRAPSPTEGRKVNPRCSCGAYWFHWMPIGMGQRCVQIHFEEGWRA